MIFAKHFQDVSYQCYFSSGYQKISHSGSSRKVSQNDQYWAS